eukprot:jgi/Chrzof1/604/Cz01g22040.t1
MVPVHMRYAPSASTCLILRTIIYLADAPPSAWAQLAGVPHDTSAPVSFILLADPTYSSMEELMNGLDYAYPQANKIGGLTSAGSLSSTRMMFAWSHNQGESMPMMRTGALVMSWHGDVTMELLVAQGCRPLNDKTYTIDKVGGGQHVVMSVTNDKGVAMSPLEALQYDLMDQASNKQQLMALLSNLTAGLAPDSLTSPNAPEPQDFLIRGMAVDKAGFLVVGDKVRAGQCMRFMVRDKSGAQEDLNRHGVAYKRRELAAIMSSTPQPPAFGMLVFSCNGRGTGLYDEPHYDSRTLASYIPVPCSGFMCNGEIGTVAGNTKLHGFTCAVAVLRNGAAISQATDSSNSSSSSSTHAVPPDSTSSGSS